VLRNPNQPELEYEMRDAEEAGRTIGRKILIVKAAGEAEFNAAFATIVQAGAGALLVRGDLSSSTGVGFWSRLPTATPCRRAM
jgi:putative ABC transport system substrate-binding protein